MPRRSWIPPGIAAAGLLAFAVARGDTTMLLWLAAAIALMWLPAWYWLARPFARDRARRANGQCTRCGYDLRGNVSGVCPECGQAT